MLPFYGVNFLTHFPEVDVVVFKGRRVNPFLHLVRSFEKDQRKELDTINGIAFRKNGHPFKNPGCRGLLKNLDDLPDPAVWFDFQHVALTRGCPGGNCTFCGSPRFSGKERSGFTRPIILSGNWNGSVVAV